MEHQTTRRGSRALALALAVLAAAALLALPATAAAQDLDQPSSVDVEFTPSGEDAPCRDPFFALSNTVSDTPEAFVLRITVAAPLCYPLEVAAAIYEMPGDGAAWPQTLAERLDFTISEPGVWVVTFTKGCGAAQFDVLTGDTPETISPTGPYHGPLLFPFDTGTTLQYEGPECAEVSPTTEVPPSTEVPVVEAEEDVLGVTTVPTDGPQVLGITQESPEALAFTGPSAASSVAAVVGGALLLAGLSLLVVRARVTD